MRPITAAPTPTKAANHIQYSLPRATLSEAEESPFKLPDGLYVYLHRTL